MPHAHESSLIKKLAGKQRQQNLDQEVGWKASEVGPQPFTTNVLNQREWLSHNLVE
jgi:hypothetical protein